MKQYPLLIVLLVSGIALAATCAEDAFVDACQNCQFDEYGKMNQTCYESYQARGQTCVGTAYPGMATQYIMGGCPAIEACASNLQLCKNLYTTGNDSKDCDFQYFVGVRECFKDADACAYNANQSCTATENENNVFVRLLDAILGMCNMGFMIAFLGILAAYTDYKRSG